MTATPDNPLRERLAEALAGHAGSKAFLADGHEWEHARTAWYAHADVVLAEVNRDMRVLADEVTRLSAVTGQLRALATRWQATVRPGEPHPAAAAILNILDDAGPTVREAAANDRRWPLEKAGE